MTSLHVSIPPHLIPDCLTDTVQLPFQTHGLGQFEDYSPWAVRVDCPPQMLPTRDCQKSAGYDLRAPVKVIIPPRGSAVINTYCKVEFPSGHYGKIEGRSGLAVHYNIIVFGGVIDEYYRGNIHVKLFNMSDSEYIIEEGDRVAQMVIQRYANLSVHRVDTINACGTTGFGSSGR